MQPATITQQTPTPKPYAALSYGGLTHERVAAALRYAEGSRRTAFRFDLLDMHDNRIGELSPLPGGRIEVDTANDIKRVATFVLRRSEFKDVNWLTERIQPWMRVRVGVGVGAGVGVGVGDTWAEWPLGVFMLSTPRNLLEQSPDTGVQEVEAYDRSLILREDKTTNRFFIREGAPYIETIRDILSAAGICRLCIMLSVWKVSAIRIVVII